MGATGFGAAVDDEEDDVISEALSVTLGCKPLAKKEQEKGRGRKGGRACRPENTREGETNTPVGFNSLTFCQREDSRSFKSLNRGLVKHIWRCLKV